uniref:PPM-type phosphatase domain-containing protein n=1 Tax=Angiostrongylus cantonensis TaxID=6313 RepID=A0A0K0D534_ANGCA
INQHYNIIGRQPYPYSRPEFLYFSDDEVLLSADQRVRPVLCPKYSSRIPLYAGYAEVINAGKTLKNEDQASARVMTLVQQGCDAEPFISTTSAWIYQINEDIKIQSQSAAGSRVEAAFFAIFDGHAGTGAALVAARCLHEHVKARLSEVLELILQLDRSETLLSGRSRSDSSYSVSKVQVDAQSIRCDELVIGALEGAFVDMDSQIAEDKQTWRISGGCAAIAVLVLLGKLLYLVLISANAGDCRAVLVTEKSSRPLSSDFTPAAERKRLQSLVSFVTELTKTVYQQWNIAITGFHFVVAVVLFIFEAFLCLIYEKFQTAGVCAGDRTSLLPFPGAIPSTIRLCIIYQLLTLLHCSTTL